MLLPQIILIPVLIITQNISVQLGVQTGKGHGELIKLEYGDWWAWLSVVTLVVACCGGVISEMSGIAAAGDLANIPKWASVLVTCVFLMVVVCTGSYRTVEGVALAVGTACPYSLVHHSLTN